MSVCMPADRSVSIPAPDFNALIRQHYAGAYRFAYRLTGNRADAEDLTQDAFVRAHTAFATYDRQRPFWSWLQRIIYHLFVDGLRRTRNSRSLSLEAYREGHPDGLPAELEIADDTDDPARRIMDGALDERLEAALAALPVEFRATIVLCDVEGRSYEEIALTMGCSMGTVRSRIHRGRKLMRLALEGVPRPRRGRRAVASPALAAA